MTTELKNVAEYLRELYPNLQMVVFDPMGNWQYFAEDFESFNFESITDDKFQSLLESAQSSVDSFPAVYDLRLLDAEDWPIAVGDTVSVPEPNETDIHQHEFEGTVAGFRNGYVTVEDQENNFFEIEPERLYVSE